MHDANWDDLRFFLAAARHGGFGAAGRALEQQQSTVSRRVAALEATLGSALFDRTAKGLALTVLGSRVLQEAQAMEQALTRVSDAASTTERAVQGLVRVAMTETLASVFVIPEVLPRLLERYPRLRLDLVIGNTSADLARREADIAMRFFLMPSGDLVTKKAARMQTGVLAARRVHKSLAKKTPAQWPFVSSWLPTGQPPEEAWREAYARGEVRVTTNSFHSQVEAVRAGLGVAVLPLVLCEPLGLAALPLPDEVRAPPPLDLHLVTPRALRNVPRVAAVFDALSESLGALSK